MTLAGDREGRPRRPGTVRKYTTFAAAWVALTRAALWVAPHLPGRMDTTLGRRNSMIAQRQRDAGRRHDTAWDGQWEQHRRSAARAGEGMATGLGWLSLALGLPALARPRAVARTAGFRGDRLDQMVVRLVGAREILTGIGILTRRRPTGWVWGRVAGDVMDVAVAGYQLASGRASQRTRAMATLAALVPIAAADVRCALQLTRGGAAARAADGRQTITVWRPPAEIYNAWRDVESFPRFMRYVESVEARTDGRSHWRARGPFGVVEWEAEIVADRPNELIAWRSLPGSEVDTAGEVRFRTTPDGRGTEIAVEIRYDPPAGGLGRTVARLAGRDPVQEAHDDLRRFKQVIEVGEVVLSDATIDGAGMPQRPAQPPERAPRASGGVSAERNLGQRAAARSGDTSSMEADR